MAESQQHMLEPPKHHEFITYPGKAVNSRAIALFTSICGPEYALACWMEVVRKGAPTRSGNTARRDSFAPDFWSEGLTNVHACMWTRQKQRSSKGRGERRVIVMAADLALLLGVN